MSILRGLIVGSSNISSVFGIPASKDRTSAYYNAEFNSKLFGTPIDYYLNLDSEAKLEQFVNDGESKKDEQLNGVFMITHRDEDNGAKTTIAVGVKDDILLVVADARGLIWTHPNLSTRSIQRETLRKVMSPDHYDRYIHRKVSEGISGFF